MHPADCIALRAVAVATAGGYPEGVNSRAAALPLLASAILLPLLAGCHAPSLPGVPADSANRQALTETERQQLEEIPPPSKNRYMAVRSLDSWENPYLTVQPGMVTLHVLRADVNTDPHGAGGLLRPTNARRQDLNLSLDQLGDALASVPQDAWPYGRVVALEEAHQTPAAGEPQVRRNMEAAMRTLNDLGVVVYEWPTGLDQGR